MKKYILGIIFVMLVAFLSRLLHEQTNILGLENIISEALIAIILGIVINNLFDIPQTFRYGVKFSQNKILRLGIILLGLRLNFLDVVKTGYSAITLILLCITLVTFLTVKFIKIPGRLGILIGVGTAICGNSAIIATAPVIDAKDEEVSFAVATITLFGLIAVLVYPLIGTLMGMSDNNFGLWVGTAVNDTSQVVAAGAAYSTGALEVATVVKLIRNTLMMPIIVLIGVFYNLKKKFEEQKDNRRLKLSSIIPWFVVGFLMMSLMRTLGSAFGIFPDSTAASVGIKNSFNFLDIANDLSKFFILMALSAIGLNTSIAELKKNSVKYIFIGLVLSSILAIFSLSLIELLMK